jgi:hypothetical protein
MPRPLAVLLKGTGVAVAVVASGVPVAVAQTPTRDSVVAVGSTAQFTSFDLRWSSGPFGEKPTGMSTVVFQGTTYRQGPPLTPGAGCLRVRGDTATVAGPTSGSIANQYGKVTMVDNGPSGDTFAAEVSVVPLDCSTPTVTLRGPLLTGDVVVVDALPTARPLRASLAVVPRLPRCDSSAVTVTLKVTARLSLVRVRLSLDGRTVARGKRRRYKVRLPLSDLRPGGHRLEAVVLDSASNEARALVTIRRCRNTPFTG